MGSSTNVSSRGSSEAAESPSGSSQAIERITPFHDFQAVEGHLALVNLKVDESTSIFIRSASEPWSQAMPRLCYFSRSKTKVV